MEPEPIIHNEAILLTGYVNNTLTSQEREQVSLHLPSCESCQQELQEVKIMQAALKTVIEERPGPSPAAFSTLMRRIEQEKNAQALNIQQASSPPWWESIESAFRSLFAIQWVPAFATVLIVSQAVLLFSLMGGPEGQMGPSTSPIIERGIPQGTVETPHIHITVGFHEQAPERQIRTVIQELGGRIIDGPSPEGLYTLAFPQTSASSSERLIAQLQQYSQVVRVAQPGHP